MAGEGGECGGSGLRRGPANLWQHPYGLRGQNTRSMKFKANEDINPFATRVAPEETIKVQLHKDLPISVGSGGWKKIGKGGKNRVPEKWRCNFM